MITEIKLASATQFDVTMKGVTKGQLYTILHAIKEYAKLSQEAKDVLKQLEPEAKKADFVV